MVNQECAAAKAEASRSGQEAERQADLASKWGNKVLDMAKELDTKQKMLDLAVSHDKVMKEKAEEVCVCVGLPFAWVCLVSAPCLLYSYYVGCPPAFALITTACDRPEASSKATP